MSSHFGAVVSTCMERMLRAVGNSSKKFRKPEESLADVAYVDSIIRFSSSLELRYSCCFERSPCLSNRCALYVAHYNVRESAAKKKLPKRNLKTSRHL